MDYREATDRLTNGPTLDTLAEAMGLSGAAIRQARMDESAVSYRKPPVGWQVAVAKLARERSAELAKLADQLERGG